RLPGSTPGCRAPRDATVKRATAHRIAITRSLQERWTSASRTRPPPSATRCATRTDLPNGGEAGPHDNLRLGAADLPNGGDPERGEAGEPRPAVFRSEPEEDHLEIEVLPDQGPTLNPVLCALSTTLSTVFFGRENARTAVASKPVTAVIFQTRRASR